MNRRRISIALIAATSTLLASVTPAVAQSADLSGSDDSTPTSTTATAVEVEDEDDEVNDDPEPGSRFMGPRELASSIATGNGSSGMPDDWSGHDDDDTDTDNGGGNDDEINLDDYPEWMHSSIAPSRDVEMFFVILNAILTVGGALTQAAVILAPIIGTDRLRDILTDFGINLDA